MLLEDVKKICINPRILLKVDKFPHGVTMYHMAALHGHIDILLDAILAKNIDIS